MNANHTLRAVFAKTSTSWEASFLELYGYPIVDFAVYGGKLYAVADNALYIYDGSWSAINASFYATSLEPYEDKLYLGGQFGLYSFDGTIFNLIFPVPTYIRVLGVYNDTLYAATFLDKPPTLYYCRGGATYAANWNVDVGFATILDFAGPFGSIDSFAVYNSSMYVASGDRVFCYNGTNWSIANIGYEYAYAYMDMAVYNGKLYLATRDKPTRYPMSAGGTGFSGALIEFDGTNWATILGHDYWLYSLEVYDNKLYVGTADRIYSWDGTVWDVSFYAPEGASYAISMTTFDGALYAGIGNGYIFKLS